MQDFALASAPLLLAPLALLFAGLAALALEHRARKAAASLAMLAVAVAALTLGVDARAALSGKIVLGTALRVLRVGSLDLVLGLSADRRGLIAAFAVLIVTAGVAVRALRAASADQPSRRILPASLVGASGALLACLAEGVPTLALGLVITWWALSPPSRDRSSTLSDAAFTTALAATLAAFGVLFWSLGGRWIGDGSYISDYKARFVVLNPDTSTSPTGVSRNFAATGTLTLVTHPGARVYTSIAEESQLSERNMVGVSPFVRTPVPIGLSKIAIAPGGGAILASDGLEVALLDVVAIREGKETVIGIVGPTLTFHEIDRQLSPAIGSRSLGSSHSGTWMGALASIALLALALAGGLAAASREAPAYGARLAFYLVAVAAAAAALAPLAAMAPWVATVAALAIAAATLYAARSRASLGAPAAALVAIAGLACAPLAAVTIACALGPCLAAVTILERAAERKSLPAADPKSEAKSTARKSKGEKKKKKNVGERGNPPAEVSELPASAQALPTPIALLLAGLLAGFASLVARALTDNLGRGLLFAVATAVACAAVAWSARSSLPDLNGVKEMGLALALSLFGAAYGVAAALTLKSWGAGATTGPIVAVGLGALVTLPAWLAPRLAKPRTASAAPSSPDEGAPTAQALTAFERAGALADRLLGFPLELPAMLLASREPPRTTDSPPAASDAADAAAPADPEDEDA
ncbi:MAG: hypothetical protein U0271_04260 [Polyangiaceae bacterium]